MLKSGATGLWPMLCTSIIPIVPASWLLEFHDPCRSLQQHMCLLEDTGCIRSKAGTGQRHTLLGEQVAFPTVRDELAAGQP